MFLTKFFHNVHFVNVLTKKKRFIEISFLIKSNEILLLENSKINHS